MEIKMPQPRSLPAIVTLALFLAGAADGAALSDTEQQLAEVVDSRQSGALALLQQAVEINSGTMNPEGVKRVGELFGDALEKLAFEVSWVDGADFDRAGHLVARHRGSGPHLLLIGHLDTVFEPDSPFRRFERLGAERAKGPGIIDMKGGDVIIVEALAALKAVGALVDLQITVVMTGDEESSGRPLSDARRVLLEAADAADVALGFEDGDGNPETSAEIEFTDGYPPLAPTDGNRRLLSLYDRASRDLESGRVSAVDPGAAGAADISFTAGRVAMALDGLGLMGEGGHTERETADLATLPTQTKRAAVLMYRLRNLEIPER
jgi:hypothetical protein